MRIEPVGDAHVWWVPRPPGPRTSVRAAVSAGALLALGLGAAVVCTLRHGLELWPWPTVVPMTPTASQLAVRYLSLACAGLLYLVLRSLPGWLRVRRVLRSDEAAVGPCMEENAWAEAACRLHRCAHLRRELYGPGRMPSWTAEADVRIRPHLASARRVYVHYRGEPPRVPDRPEAGFAPCIVPVSVAGGWWMVPIVLVLAAAVLADLGTAVHRGSYGGLASVNFVVAATVVVVYLGTHLLALLGWRTYFRFAPGVAEVLNFRVWRSRPDVSTVQLGEYDALVDVTGPSIVLTLVERDTRAWYRVWQLRNTAENREVCLRALLSGAEVPDLSREHLMG
ncbi:MAG: hypothetical protein JXB13_09885 [Phycisphaerae bacterium]|nr:hypothetical protein [Phycisphaerae bacterium]